MFRRSLPACICFVLLWSARHAICAEPVNLARSAMAVASDHAQGRDAEYMNDGDTSSLWEPATKDSAKSWVELHWSSAMTFREVLVRQSLRRDLNQFTIQVRQKGQWASVKTLGDGTTPLSKVVLTTLPVQTSEGLRLTAFKGEPAFYEIEVYEGPSPPVLELAGDARGHIIGVLTDAFGTAAIAGAPVSFSGRAGGRSWKATVATDEHGMLSLNAPAGLSGSVHAVALVNHVKVEKSFEAGDLSLAFSLPDAGNPGLSLNGVWKFAPDPPPDFIKPGYNDGSWKPITVPSHWTLQGYQSADGVGGYRRQITFREDWIGRRIKIHFDGVYSGAEVWLNGQRVGSHEGGFTPFQVDVTNAAKKGANLLALRVWEKARSASLDNMSFYADFPLTGIIRKAYAFAIPAAHIDRLHMTTTFDREYKDATLKVDLKLVNESSRPIRNGEVRWRLQDPEGRAVTLDVAPLRFSLGPWDQIEKTVELAVHRPLHWEAEHPRLYRLSADLYEGVEELERVERTLGFRQVEIRGTEILINGVRVKLKGACHHDSHPTMGRAVTSEVTRRDLELIKGANLNALRTSHYPPIPELSDLADQLGVYVEAEAPFCWVTANQSYDLRLAPLVVQHTAELLERDRSHPAIIIWSMANESDWGPVFDRSVEYVRKIDNTRPLAAAISKELDILTRHNPIDLENMRKVRNSKTPVLWDESMTPFMGIGGWFGDQGELWRDPGLRDYWIVPYIEVYNEILSSPVIQGHMVWCWADDIFQVPWRGSEHGRSVTRVHDIDLIYHAPGKGVVGEAAWGIIDGWRRLKPEYWHFKKLHSPAKVTKLETSVPPAGEPLLVPIQNRFEFTNLSELTMQWQLGDEKGSLHPEIEPQKQGEVRIPIQHPITPGSSLMVRFLTSSGELVDAESITIGQESLQAIAPRAYPKLEVQNESILAGSTLTIKGEGFELAFDKGEGLIRRALAGDQMVIYASPQLHVLPTEPADWEFPHPWDWKPTHAIDVKTEGENLLVTTFGQYHEAEGNITYRISPAGDVDVSYDFTYQGHDMLVKEIGLRLVVPPWCDTLRWKRKGEWSDYPDDHIGRNAGVARAHSGLHEVPPAHPHALDDSPMGTNDFRSTKRHITFASITDSEGHGIAVNSDGTQHIRANVSQDGIAIYLNDWFGGSSGIDDAYKLNYGRGKLIKTGESLKGTFHFSLVSKGSAPH